MRKLDSPFLALKMEGVGPMSQGSQADSQSRKRQGNGFFLRLSDKSVALPTPYF